MKIQRHKHDQKFKWKEFLLISISFILLYFIFIINTQINYPFTQGKMKKNHFAKMGDKPTVDGYAIRDFRFEDKEETERQQEEAKLAIPLIFFNNHKICEKMVKDYSIFQTLLLEGIADGLKSEKISLNLKSKFKRDFSPNLIDSIIAKKDYTLLLDKCYLAIENISKETIISEDFIDSGFYNKEDSLRVVKNKKRGSLFETFIFSDLLTEQQALKVELDSMREDVSSSVLNNSARILELFVLANTSYDSSLTKRAQKDAEEEILPVYIQILKGENIFLKDIPLTEFQYKKILALSSFGAIYSWTHLIFMFFYLLLIYFLVFLFFYPPFLKQKLALKEFSILTGLLLSGILYSLLVSQIVPPFMKDISRYFPISLLVIVASILMTPKIGFYFGIIFILFHPLFNLLSPDLGVNIEFLLLNSVFFGIIPIIISVWSVKNLVSLFDYLKSGTIVTLSALGLSLFYLLAFTPYSIESFKILFYVFLNGIFLTLLAPGLVLFFEKFFNITTTHLLVELANTALPIFQQMMVRAPGTYTHSMQVANLASMASVAVGANALLARVGSYYHDIGKVEQPEYFIENQKFENKHDELRPNLSVTVIKSHVKKGLEKGKQLNLPPEVLDIIEQHHGNSLITYFYMRALMGNVDILRDDYRYDSKIPQSKEAAIVMLSDCVEAATRSLKNPTPQQLDKFIWKIILDKLTEEQLNDSQLTFPDLKKIKEVYISILVGQNHTRVSYPALKDEKKKNNVKDKQKEKIKDE